MALPFYVIEEFRGRESFRFWDNKGGCNGNAVRHPAMWLPVPAAFLKFLGCSELLLPAKNTDSPGSDSVRSFRHCLSPLLPFAKEIFFVSGY